jgi:hypothetical protein
MLRCLIFQVNFNLLFEIMTIIIAWKMNFEVLNLENCIILLDKLCCLNISCMYTWSNSLIIYGIMQSSIPRKKTKYIQSISIL